MRLCCALILCPAFSVLCLAFPLLSELAAVPDELPFPPLTLRPQTADFDGFDLTSALPPASITRTEPISTLPPTCAAYLGPDGECTTSMLAADVYLEDCGTPFTICRCADAQMSLDVALDRFARVPVGLRRYAGTVVVLGAESPHAYTLTTGDTHFFGDCAMNTWVHEITHAFDFAGGLQSNSSEWNAALAADTCVPDEYASRNQVEDFAQVGVLKTYMLLYGALPPGFQPDCMATQLAFMDSLPLYDAPILFGNTCRIGDEGPSARHTQAPAILDPSRTFESLAPQATSTSILASAAAVERPSGASQPWPWAVPGVLILISIAGTLVL